MSQAVDDFRYAVRTAIIKMLGPADGMCRHCGSDLWLKDKGVWVSYVRMARSRNASVAGPEMSRFCPRDDHVPKHEHAPLRLDRPDQLEAWLADGQE